MKRRICGMTSEDLFKVLNLHGFSRVQSDKVLLGIYRKGVTQLSKIDGVPKALKELLSAEFITGVYPPVTSQKSFDNTVKYLFRNEDGLEFETVYLPDNKRRTVCISTQSGCRMGCPFCLTARYGFRGNLSAGDMINQIISLPEARSITHVVFMGMGEPMDNLKEVLKACEILVSDFGLAIGSRNVTVSTVGILPAILEFLEETNCNLTLSLHSPFPDERKLVVTAENRYPSHQIINEMRFHPLKKKRRFSIAYVMIKDINDTDRHLEALKKLLINSQIRVNLLFYHQIHDNPYCSSTKERMLYFKHNLVISGISPSIRKSRGEDISAACGLLASGLAKK